MDPLWPGVATGQPKSARPGSPLRLQVRRRRKIEKDAVSRRISLSPSFSLSLLSPLSVFCISYIHRAFPFPFPSYTHKHRCCPQKIGSKLTTVGRWYHINDIHNGQSIPAATRSDVREHPLAFASRDDSCSLFHFPFLRGPFLWSWATIHKRVALLALARLDPDLCLCVQSCVTKALPADVDRDRDRAF